MIFTTIGMVVVNAVTTSKLWTYAELYSEHYRCATRNNLTISRHREDLGNRKLGDSIDLQPSGLIAGVGGFLQAPTLVRLPPGITLSDDGGLKRYNLTLTEQKSMR